MTTFTSSMLRFGVQFYGFGNTINKLFEQLAIGNLTDERFRTLTADYEAEQSKLKKRSEEITTKLDDFSS